jgi:hypothetical protein
MTGKAYSKKSNFEEKLKGFIEQLENEKQALNKILRSVDSVERMREKNKK